ncbi:hypothetical protein TraAM80_05485 [Trypanosoma rangeli]|uniref:Uncharacterized protein n=1 Tax=Trypanosoma rangeli TaxID=5698 RepID=A0A3R7K9I4_TRYRA|nr:uncharacterized protein TraAM80_05485 [Trypanosoma rangeli]RNF03889.1 hypothetical protein TraAM80_05485 [Trypanosoma rangeli]|eukprot:RNF03889.1 hypothetical protein TraAM80_05485 [Trypanosoma rangeli]
MSSKEEVVALMAHGDAEAKISLLKKAVVSVTKQKQMLEQHNKQLQDQMAAIGAELARVQEENMTLRRDLNAAEGELGVGRKRGHFAASVRTTLKGLSSFVTGTDGEDGGAAAKRTRGAELSPEDKEKLVAENETIHMQLFDLRKMYENERQQWKTERERLSSECTAMQQEVTELRKLLDSTAHACDRLNMECTRQAALAQFCHHFFVSSWNTAEHPQRIHVVMAPSLATKRGGVPPREVREELALGTLTGVTAFIRTLMSAVSVLVASLRDSFSTQMRGITLVDMRCYRDRLSVLLEAHGVQRAGVIFHVTELEEALTATAAPDEKLTQIQRVQGLLISSLNNWLGMVCEHVRLIIDACMKVESHNLTEHKKDKQAFIESATLGAVSTIAAIRGSLEALQDVCDTSCTLFKQQACDSTEWLLALERFWWEGCGASSSLRWAVESLREQLQEISKYAPSNDHVRAALQFMCKSLETFASRAWSTKREVTCLPTSEVPRAPSLVDHPANPTITCGFASADNEELVAALAAADRAAVCYHTQMNYTLLELAEKQEALANAQEDVRRLMSVNQQLAEDANRAREVFETQIRLLSDQLVECSNGGGGNTNW